MRNKPIILSGVCFALVVMFIASLISNLPLLPFDDFPSYYYAGKLALAGHDIYKPIPRVHPYIYPPFFSLLVGPLTLLNIKSAALIWLALNIVLYLASAWLLYRILFKDYDDAILIWTAVIAAGLIPAQLDLLHGQVNTFILFLLTAALWSYVNRRDLLCGILIGLAAAIKITPALLVLFFLVKKEYRVVLGALAALLITLFIPIPFFGIIQTVFLLDKWFDLVISPFILDAQVRIKFTNQSLTATVYRLLTHANVKETGGPYYVNFLSLPRETAKWFIRGLSAVILLVGYFVVKKPSGRDSSCFFAQYSIVLLSMLILSGISWHHHYVLMLLPFMVSLKLARETGSKYFTVGMGVSFISVNLSFVFWLGEHWAVPLSAYSVMFWGALLLWVIHVSWVFSSVAFSKKSGNQVFFDNNIRHS